MTAVAAGAAVAVWWCWPKWSEIWIRLLLAMLLYMTMSLAWTPNVEDGEQELIWWIVLAIVLMLGSSGSGDGWTGGLIGLALAVGVSTGFVILQVTGLWQPLVRGSPWAGLFINPNYLGETAAVTVVAGVALRRHWMTGVGLVALALTWSKGGALAGAVGGLWVLGWRWSALTTFVCACLAGTAWGLYGPPSSAGIRLGLWADTLRGLEPFGRGIGSYWTGVLRDAHGAYLIERYDHAHNDGLELVFELGVGAVPLVGLAWLAWQRGRDRVAKSILLTICTAAVWGFPWHCGATAWIGALAAGRCLGGAGDLGFGLDEGRTHAVVGQRKRAGRYGSAASGGRPVPAGSASSAPAGRGMARRARARAGDGSGRDRAGGPPCDAG